MSPGHLLFTRYYIGRCQWSAGLIGFVGFILFMVAMYNLSKYYGEPAIFQESTEALIVAIVATVILGVVLVAFLWLPQSVTPKRQRTRLQQPIGAFLGLRSIHHRHTCNIDILRISHKTCLRQISRQIRSGQLQNRRAAPLDRQFRPNSRLR